MKKIQLEKVIACYQNGLDDLLSYLNLPKFQGVENNFVNPDDIRLRINELKNSIFDMDFKD